MADSVSDGQNRQVFHSDTNSIYKVTIPTGWVSNHENQLKLTAGGYTWGDLYEGSPPGMPELPDNIKAQFGLNAPLPVPVQGRARENEGQDAAERRVRGRGGKSKKRPTRRGRSSKARKSRKARSTRRR